MGCPFPAAESRRHRSCDARVNYGDRSGRAEPEGTMDREPGPPEYDPESVRAKYLAERDKRLVPGRAEIRALAHDERFARFREDPFTPFTERPPLSEDVDVVVVGGGIAGVLAGAELRRAGVE